MSPPVAESYFGAVDRSRAGLAASKIGRGFLRLILVARDLGAFFLITLSVIITKSNVASKMMHPMMRREMTRAGVRLLPMAAFMALGIGFLVIGQSVALLTRVGAQELTGKIMVAVVIRELGPAVTALLMLSKIGTATVIELGTARAMGEIEALEALGIDPVHYLVAPRVCGMALSTFALTVYSILLSLAGGYLFAFLQNVPLTPEVYLSQIANALRWSDFILLALKTAVFGGVISMTCCYEGLARPLTLGEVSEATTRAVMQSVVLCVVFDGIFLIQTLV